MAFVSWSSRPINVDLPSSTLPTVEKRRSSFCAFCASNSLMRRPSVVAMSEVPLALLGLHRAIGIVVDDTRGALGGSGHEHLLDDLLHGGGARANGSRTRDAAEAAESAQHALDGLRRTRAMLAPAVELAVEANDLAAADDDVALAREVERVDRDLLDVDVLPHVELGPVGEREHADRFTGIDPGVVEVPELGTLVL